MTASSSIDIYPQSRTPRLDPAQFQNPSAIFRGTPFWSWNNKLDIDQLKRQIDWLQEMGLGGFHMHARSGLDTAYLGDEFMAAVKACVEYGAKKGMISWLYDEDRWPSGSAGGLVTKDHQYRARHLLFTCRPYANEGGTQFNTSTAHGSRMENGQLLASYDVVLAPDGTLQHYKRLEPADQAVGKIWYAYLETAGDSPWFNGQAYVDTLNPKAIRQFIRVTHERYYQVLKPHFGKEVPAIFTDEPQFPHKGQFRAAAGEADVVLPWTGDFLESFDAAYAQKLQDHLPELFWELPDHQPSLARYRYHDHVAERFAQAFADTCGQWCENHGVALTGHMMEEPTLQSQTAAIGDCMRSYRSFQLPGIDMLCDWREYTTAKQAQSAAHQYGRPGVLSELYGVTDWDFPFVGHKGQGDWQAAMGVTVRVHHLSWVSMAGEAKRDYPASISYQSAWFREYPFVENHFARLNTVLTRGNPGVRVGVIHPVESYWLCFGPLEQTKMERESRDADFQNLTQWLLHGLIDFNFICEAQLPSLNPTQTADKFTVGKMAYDAVVVPGMRTIRASTLDRLEAFAKAGGKVIFAGEIPSLVDARPSDRAYRLAEIASVVGMNKLELLGALDPVRDLEVRLSDGGLADSLFYQLRHDGELMRLFICNTDRINGRHDTTIKFRGDWDVEFMDTFTGEIRPIPARQVGPWTVVDYHFQAHGHALLTYSPRSAQQVASQSKPVAWRDVSRLADPVPVTLSEPNALLLDQAQWKVNDSPWQPIEEILRLENLARTQLGLKPQTGGDVQPWADTGDKSVLGQVTVRFQIRTTVQIDQPDLALEDAANRVIKVDGKIVPSAVVGWYVDESIHRVKLPALPVGEHAIEVTIPYHRKTCIEWHYLLGDFGVQLGGRHATIVAPVRSLAFGDWTSQGLPFYTGNVTYHCAVEGNGNRLAIRAPHFRAALLSATLDKSQTGKIAFAPFRHDFGPVATGVHTLDITAFGTRYNGFGSLHWVKPGLWVGPGAWRTTGDQWSYEYQIRPAGILVSPTIESGQ